MSPKDEKLEKYILTLKIHLLKMETNERKPEGFISKKVIEKLFENLST